MFLFRTLEYINVSAQLLVAFQRNQEAVEHSLRAKLKHSELGREADLVLRKESFLKKILVSMEY